jgi:hypothetical protein
MLNYVISNVKHVLHCAVLFKTYAMITMENGQVNYKFIEEVKWN